MSKLLFIYNANSGIGNLVLDVAHKLFRPETYACNLCTITHNTFSENKAWKTFREQSTIDMDFLHIDEFETKYKETNFEYPIILKEEDTIVKPFLSKAIINTFNSVEDLIAAIKSAYN